MQTQSNAPKITREERPSTDIMSLMHRKDPPWPGEYNIEGFPLSGFEFDVTDARTHPHLAIRWAGRELLADNRVVETVKYPYAIIGFSVQGEHILKSPGQEHRIGAGMAFWIRDLCDTTRISIAETYPISYLVMLFGNDLPEVWAQHLATPAGAIHLNHPHLVESVMMDIMEEGRFDSPHKEQNCLNLAQVLVSRIGNAIVLRAEEGQTAKTTYRRCRQYIASHFATIRSLTQVAEACGISIPYLCRLFENYADTSPYELLTQLRLRKAAMMLATTRLPVANIAQAVGYRNIPQFSRMFKSAFGVPPSRYSHNHVDER
jgi:AraC-like DNA-binding protein